MCGIAAVLSLRREPLPGLARAVATMNDLQRHRGPDGDGAWLHPEGFVGFGHRRLSVIDPETGRQPMTDGEHLWITYSGETYNYHELRACLPGPFRTRSDVEAVLHAYRRWGPACLAELRGMFAFALWDDREQTLFCARDRFGIKPLYYAVVDGVLYLASEAKALLPWLPAIDTDVDAVHDYLTFQFFLNGKTPFKGVRELRPGHALCARRGAVEVRRYWSLPGAAEDPPGSDIEARLRARVDESVSLHLRADVPIGAYVSGGLDSGIVAALAAGRQGPGLLGFTGTFSGHPAYDERGHARTLAAARDLVLHEVDITADDFVRTIEALVYHLDFPVAGPGSFAQYVVSSAAGAHRKVLLGGQGGDELFGGYARYLIASAPSVGSAENPVAPPGYAPLLAELDRGEPPVGLAERYFKLINRAGALADEIDWSALGAYRPLEEFRGVFASDGGSRASDLDRMMRFDLQTLLPALLQVEDRVSMAHGLETRVPLLDHPLAELAATIPAALKIEGGTTKRVLRRAMADVLPASIVDRPDKMGFPVPFHEWIARPGPVREFVIDTFSSRPARERGLVHGRAVLATLDAEPPFGRRIWGLLCLELWQRAFHDQGARFRRLGAREADA